MSDTDELHELIKDLTDDELDELLTEATEIVIRGETDDDSE